MHFGKPHSKPLNVLGKRRRFRFFCVATSFSEVPVWLWLIVWLWPTLWVTCQYGHLVIETGRIYLSIESPDYDREGVGVAHSRYSSPDRAPPPHIPYRASNTSTGSRTRPHRGFLLRMLEARLTSVYVWLRTASQNESRVEHAAAIHDDQLLPHSPLRSSANHNETYRIIHDVQRV